MSKLLEDIVLSIAIALGLLIGLYLSYAVAVQGAQYPPTLITLFLAVGVAALIYRFMGGLGGTTFEVGLLKLGGTAAFFIGMIWFVGDRLKDEIGLYASSQPYLTRIQALEGERNEARDLAQRFQTELRSLRGGATRGDCPVAQCTIAEVRRMQPNDPFVQAMKRLVEGQEPPFNPTLREMSVRVSVVGGLGSTPAFQVCGDTLAKLNEGVDVPNPEVRFSRTLADGSNAAVSARRMGRIGEDVCSADQRDFDVQINCAVATTLFSDKISSCAEGAGLRGSRVSIASLAG